MRALFVVNDPAELTGSQTTSMLARALVRRGHTVHFAGVANLALREDGHVMARGHALGPGLVEARSPLGAVMSPNPEAIDLSEIELVWIRTNPARGGRGWAHQTMLNLLRIARDGGTTVVNDPVGLARASSKLYLHRVPPAFRPRTLVSGDREEISAFIAGCSGGKAVLKPLTGTRGQDVYLIELATERNLNAIIDTLVRDGYAIVQEFVPEAMEGDTRLVLLFGALLEAEGVPLVVRRVPTGMDFRSNVHVGGRAVPTAVTASMRECASVLGPILMEDGLGLVGVDFIGGKVVELNVFSTGGFWEAEQFYEAPFIETCVAEVVAHVQRGARSKHGE